MAAPELPDYARGLVGHWRLAAWTGESDDGERVEPGGSEPSGDLIYLPSGRMAVQIAHTRRQAFGSHDLEAGDQALRADAYRTYNAYAGTFSVPEPGTIVHHVAQALHPDQPGMEKRRRYELDGVALTLWTQPVAVAGAMASSELRWIRRNQF